MASLLFVRYFIHYPAERDKRFEGVAMSLISPWNPRRLSPCPALGVDTPFGDEIKYLVEIRVFDVDLVVVEE